MSRSITWGRMALLYTLLSTPTLILSVDVEIMFSVNGERRVRAFRVEKVSSLASFTGLLQDQYGLESTPVLRTIDFDAGDDEEVCGVGMWGVRGGGQFARSLRSLSRFLWLLSEYSFPPPSSESHSALLATPPPLFPFACVVPGPPKRRQPC